MNSSTRWMFCEQGILQWVDGLGMAVVVPVIFTQKFNGNEVVMVKWYDTHRKHQYEFHLCVTPEQIEQQCAADEENFRVIFLGPAKDFPEKSQFHAKIVERFGKNMDAYIIFAAAPIGLGPDEGGFIIPVHFVAEVVMNVYAGRLIRPETYSEADVWTWAMSNLNRFRERNADDALSLALLGKTFEAWPISDFRRFIWKEEEKRKALASTE